MRLHVRTGEHDPSVVNLVLARSSRPFGVATRAVDDERGLVPHRQTGAATRRPELDVLIEMIEEGLRYAMIFRQRRPDLAPDLLGDLVLGGIPGLFLGDRALRVPVADVDGDEAEISVESAAPTGPELRLSDRRKTPRRVRKDGVTRHEFDVAREVILDAAQVVDDAAGVAARRIPEVETADLVEVATVEIGGLDHVLGGVG